MESCHSLCRAAADGASFRVLDCGDCGIDDTGATALADLLILNNNLQRMYLNMNDVTEKGARALAAALAARPGLKLLTLDLSDNVGMGNDSAVALAAACRATAPVEIRISNCGIADVSALAFKDRVSLKENDGIKRLHLGRIDLGPETKLLLAKVAVQGDVKLFMTGEE